LIEFSRGEVINHERRSDRLAAAYFDRNLQSINQTQSLAQQQISLEETSASAVSDLFV
jgi:hypothetical protein